MCPECPHVSGVHADKLCQKALSCAAQTTCVLYWFKRVGGHETWRREEHFGDKTGHAGSRAGSNLDGLRGEESMSSQESSV